MPGSPSPLASISSLIDERDWANTPVGPRASWPQSLLTALSICLDSQFPMIIFWGPELVQFYNDAYVPIAGVKHPRALGQRAIDCWPEIWNFIGPMLNGVLYDAKSTFSEDLLLPIERDGVAEERYFTFSYSPIRDEHGIGGVFCAVAETTERVLKERDRVRQIEALAEIDRVKTAFFSNVSHEFRTPLTLMLGPLEELSREAGNRERPIVEMARRNALRLLKLVNTLLEFSRIEAGHAEPACEPTDLSQLTADLAAVFHSAIESAGLRFIVDIEPVGIAYVDPTMWERIVLNLLSNALKFTLAGEIAVRLRAANGAIEFTVSDTGSGIPESEVPRLFERFRRVRSSEARSYEGSGIGLALVQELVRLNGGTIDVASRAGEGSTFRVLLPPGREHAVPANTPAGAAPARLTNLAEQYLADVDVAIPPVKAPADVPASGTHRILVADDNGDLREYVERILSPRYTVETARNGTEALRAARENAFDLIISDVMMPEVDGFELLKAVRADPVMGRTPFIMLSARAGEESAIEGLAYGADDYLTKPFSSDELLNRVAAHLTASSIRERAVRDLRSSEQRFRTLASSMPHIVLESDPDGAITFLSEVYTTYTGSPLESGLGSGWLDAVHPGDAAGVTSRWREAMQAGEPYVAEFRLRRADGTYHWHLARILPQRDANGTIVRWTGTVTDVHEVRRVVEEREFLSNASRLLAESLDLQTTLHNLAQLAVPQFADWCQIDIRTRDGGIQTVAIAHRDPHMHLQSQKLVGRTHLNPDSAWGNPYTIRTGQSSLIGDAAAILPEAVNDEREELLYQEMGVGSAACVPLVAQGETLGAVAFVYGESGRRYTEEDLPMLEELGRRAGLAVHNAREFERQHRVAESFQEASLPASLPVIEGITFDAVYVPGSSEAQVGGDWYDAVRLFDGRVVVSIGDVAGNGLNAAVTMGNMRQIIRGIAQVHADPSLMLDAADRALRLEHPEQFVTAFVGVLDPIAKTFSYASAGHPPPMLRYADGSVEPLSDGGLPLGLRQGHEGAAGRIVDVQPGATLVLYTDGLTEATRNAIDGERKLRALLGGDGILSTPNPARALKEAFITGVAAHDDIAILVVGIGEALDRSPKGSFLQQWTFDVNDADAAHDARREFGEALLARGAAFEDVYAAEVVFGELIGNVVRYAPGPIEVTVDWSASAPVLHVLDRGPGFRHMAILPADLYSENGRGLFLVSALTQDFHVAKRPTGGSHARAVLSLSRTRLSQSKTNMTPPLFDGAMSW